MIWMNFIIDAHRVHVLLSKESIWNWKNMKNKTDLGTIFNVPETMAEHVHYLQQRLDTQLPREIIKL